MVGSKEYHEACIKASTTPPPSNRRINVNVIHPSDLAAASVLTKVALKEILPSELEIPDAFPFPPPSEFTWRHYIMLTGIQELSNAMIEMCAEVASRWVHHLDDIIDVDDQADGVFASRLLYGIWILEEGMPVDFVVHLKQTAKQALRLRNKMMKGGVEVLRICRDVELQLFDDALSEMEAWRNNRWVKRFCVACGIVLGDRNCSKCFRCSIRYCSEKCQREDWPKHKQICANVSTCKRLPGSFAGDQPK